MDAEILHTRLAAAESAIIKTDERLDALEGDERLEDHSAAHVVHDERLTALEETLAGCIAKLEAIESQVAATEETVAEAEVAVAVAEAEEARAEAIEALAEAAIAAEETGEPEMAVEEIEPEPAVESPAVAAEQKRGNWLENLLAMR